MSNISRVNGSRRTRGRVRRRHISNAFFRGVFYGRVVDMYPRRENRKAARRQWRLSKPGRCSGNGETKTDDHLSPENVRDGRLGRLAELADESSAEKTPSTGYLFSPIVSVRRTDITASKLLSSDRNTGDDRFALPTNKTGVAIRAWPWRV